MIESVASNLNGESSCDPSALVDGCCGSAIG